MSYRLLSVAESELAVAAAWYEAQAPVLGRSAEGSGLTIDPPTPCSKRALGPVRLRSNVMSGVDGARHGGG